MVVENLLKFSASSVAGIFMLFVACSLVTPGSSEINSPTTLTLASNDNDTIDSLNVNQNQIELKIHTAISSILDKHIINELNNKLLQLNDTMKQVNQDKEQTLAEYLEINKKYRTESLETLLTCNNRVLSLNDHQVNLENNLTTLELKIKDIIDEKNNTRVEMQRIIDNLQSVILSKNQQYSNISLELEKKIDENNKTIQESIALEKERAEKFKAMENEYQVNLTNKQQENEMLEDIIFEISQKNLVKSVDLLKTLISIMKINKENVPDDLLEKRRQLFQNIYDKNETVAVDDLRKRFDDIALTSNSQFYNRYFCNKKISYYDSTICALLRQYLYEIDLSHKNLAVLPKDIFTGFEKVGELYLSYNRLYYLESGTFNNLSYLRELQLDHNKLTALSNDIFNSLETLEILYLPFNQIYFLQPGTFNNLSNLKNLSIQENHLTSLPKDIFIGLAKLEYLNIASNRLNYLESGTFNGLSMVSKIWMGENNLTSLPKDIFNDLKYLEELDVSCNRLNYLDSDIFNNLPKLNNVFLYSNNLTPYSEEILRKKYRFEYFSM